MSTKTITNDPPARLSVLFVGAFLNAEGLGEPYWAFKWVEAVSRYADVTVLTQQREQNRDRLSRQLPGARVITWVGPDLQRDRFERFHAMAKPTLPLFFRWARRWIRAAHARGERFDIAHQVLPQAMRYASPLSGHPGLPYVIGAVGGSLDTPAAFEPETGSSTIAGRLRVLDRWRLRNDPWLRRGFREADLIIGVAPYVADILRDSGIPPKAFTPMLEQGVEGGLPAIPRAATSERVRLLHVGRAVRTKGLRDCVRAMAHLRDLPDVTLTSAGGGEDLEACRAEAKDLGVADRVTFLGQIPRPDVDALYREADIFVFPSFREPMGGVFFEALSAGLPVITAARGGPDFIIDQTCGIRIPVTDPAQFAKDIAGAVRDLAADPQRRQALGQGAHTRMHSFGTWDDKGKALIAQYRAVLARQPAGAS